MSFEAKNTPAEDQAEVAEPKRAYQTPKVESVQLTEEAAEALT